MQEIIIVHEVFLIFLAMNNFESWNEIKNFKGEISLWN